MELSEQRKAILELGKILVKELGLEKSVDTLSRWMAHYVSEKIKYAESLSHGVKKKNAEKECFLLILDLWKHRWHYKPEQRPLRNFQHLFDILEKLNPERKEPYYFNLNNAHLKEDGGEPMEVNDLKNLSPLAYEIDKVARIWINYLLHEAVTKAKNEKVQKIIDHTVPLPDSFDSRIIQIVLTESIEESNKKQVNKKGFDKEVKIKTLISRIEELQKFEKINEYIRGQYEKKLRTIKNGKSS